MLLQKNKRLLALLVLLLHAPLGLAERADRDKPVQLDADQMTIDDAKQTSTFSGSVKLSQGTMQLLGDRIVVTQKEGYTQATVYGNPASFKQKREGLEDYVAGYSERILYDARNETVDFYTQARIKRDQDEVRGEHISYSVKTEIFQVTGSPGTSPNTPSKRVRAILQPKGNKPVVVPSDNMPATQP
jgi:lipopolysaccharide export system protein LptA